MVAVTVPSTINFDETRDELIEDALRLAGVLDITETPRAGVSESARRTLDAYLKHMMSRGLHVFRQTEGVLFLNQDQESYELGSDGDEATRVSDLVATTLTSAASAGATTLALTSSGMAVSDRIGIALDGGTRQWTTIATIPDSASVTITTALTGAAASGNTVYTYTSKIERPLRVWNLRLRDSDGIETPLRQISRQEYMEQSDKNADGKVVMTHYSPQLDDGVLFVWPTADSITDQIRFTFERVIADADSGDGNFDFPVEWLETLKYGLALRLAHKYGKRDRIEYLKPEAEQKEAELLAFDVEDSSVFVSPEFR